MRKQRLRLLAYSLTALALTSSLVAYLLLPAHMQETSYMLAAVFLFMAAFCFM